MRRRWGRRVPPEPGGEAEGWLAGWLSDWLTAAIQYRQARQLNGEKEEDGEREEARGLLS